MAKGFNAGSVNAKINLDNSEFDEKIKDVIAQAKKASDQITASAESTKKATDQANESVKHTDKLIKNLVNSTHDLKAKQNELYGSVNQTSDSIKSEAENLKNLSQQSKKTEKDIKKVEKATEKLNRSLKFKGSKFYTKEDEEFLTELVKAIDKAEKINGRVKAKPIFDQLEKQFPDLRKHYTNIDDYKKYWTSALMDIGAYFGTVVGYGKEIVDLGKSAQFNIINVGDALTVEEVANSLKEISTSAESAGNSTEKAVEKADNSIKKLNTDLKTTDVVAKDVIKDFEVLTANAFKANAQIFKGKKGDTKNGKQFINFKSIAQQLMSKYPIFGDADDLIEYLFDNRGSSKILKRNAWFTAGVGEDFASGDVKLFLDNVEVLNSVAGKTATELEQLSTTNDKVAESTKKATVQSEAYKAQILLLGSLLKGHLQTMNQYSAMSNQIVDGMTRMARANELYSDSAQKVSQEMGHILKSINKLKEAKYNFGFKGADATDTHFIGSTLRAITNMRIMPKNPLIRMFSEEDKEILRDLYRDRGTTAHAKYWLKMPTLKQMAKDPHTEIPYVTDYTDILEPENYERAVKNAQTRIRELIKWLNIELVKEAKGNIRVWNEELGKYELFGSLDFSNMVDLGSFNEFIRYIDSLISKTYLLQQEEAEVHHQLMKINALANHMFDRIPDETKELLNMGDVFEDLTAKATKFYQVRKAISNKDFTLGGKTNYDAMAKDLERLIKLTAKSDLQRMKTYSDSARTFKHMQENRIDTLLPTDSWYDNAQYKAGALYVSLDHILSELHRKYGILIKDTKEFIQLSKKLDNNLKGLFMGNQIMGKPHIQYFPSTDELIDLLGSSFMEAWSDSIQQGELGFRNLMGTIDAIKPKLIETSSTLTHVFDIAKKGGDAVNKFHQENIKKLQQEIQLTEQLESAINRNSASYVKAKHDFMNQRVLDSYGAEYVGGNLIKPISNKEIRKYLPYFSSSKDSKQAMKQTQYEMEKILKSMGISLSKEVYEDWNGKSKRTRWNSGESSFLLGSLDISNMEEMAKIHRRLLDMTHRLSEENMKVATTFGGIDVDVWWTAVKAVDELVASERILKTQTEKTAQAISKLNYDNLLKASKIKFDDYVKIAKLSETELNALEGMYRANLKLDERYWDNKDVFGKMHWAEEIMAWAKLLPRLDLDQFFEQYWAIGSQSMRHGVGIKRFNQHLGRADLNSGGDSRFIRKLDEVAWAENGGEQEIEMLKLLQEEIAETEIRYSDLAQAIIDVKRVLNEPYGEEPFMRGLILKDLDRLRFSDLTDYGRKANAVIEQLKQLVYGGLINKALVQANQLKVATDKIVESESKVVAETEKVKTSFEGLKVEIDSANNWTLTFKTVSSAVKDTKTSLDDFNNTNNKVLIGVRDANGELKGFKESAVQATEAVEELTVEANQLEGATDKVANSERSLAKSTSFLKEHMKQTGESVKYTAGQLKVLIDLYNKANSRKNTTLVGGTPHTVAPFSRLYDYFEKEYLGVLTKYDPAKHEAKKFRKQFQARLGQLIKDLNIELTPEKQPTAKVGEYYPRKRFNGHNIGTYDAKNLIDEASFKQLIGETDKLGIKLGQIPNKLKQIKESESTVVNETENLINSFKRAKVQAEQLSKGIATSLSKYGNVFEDLYLDPSSEAEKKALDKLYESNLLKYYGKIGDDEWLERVLKAGQQIERLNLGKFIGLYGDIGKGSKEEDPFRFLGTWAETEQILKSAEESFKELDSEIKIVRATLDDFADSAEHSRIKIIDMNESFEGFEGEVRETTEAVDEFVLEAPKLLDVEKKIQTETETLIVDFDHLINTITKYSSALASAINPSNVKLLNAGLVNAVKPIVDSPIDVKELNHMVEALEQISTKQSQAREEAGRLTEEIRALSNEYQKVSESSQQFGISMYQQFKNIIPAVIKAREELLKLGEAQKLPLRIMEMPDITGKLKTPLTFLKLFQGQIKNIAPYLDSLESRLTKAFEKIKKEANDTANTINNLSNDGTQTFGALVKSVQRLPIALKKVSESYEKVGESEKRFERQSKTTAERVTSYYNNIFRQLHSIEEGIQKDFNLKPFNTRYLKDWNLYGDGLMRSGQTLAETTTALKTFDNTVLTTSKNIKEKLVQAMIKFREFAQISRIEITENMTNSWKQAIAEIEGFERRYEVLSQRMYDLSRKRGYWTNKGKNNRGYGASLTDQILSKYGVNRNTGILSLPTGKIIDFNDAELRSLFEASVMGKNGRVNVEGYSDYIARINEIKQALEGANGSTTKYQESLKLLAEAIKLTANELTGFVGKSEGVIHAMTQMAQANEKFAKTKTLGQKVTDLDTMLFGDAGLKGKGLGAVSGLTATLEHFSGLSNKHADTLTKFKQEATALADSFKVLNESMSKGAISSETYEKQIDELTEKVRRLKAEAEKGIREANLYDPNKLEQTNKGIKKSTNSLREFGKEMGQSERYADTLYRGLQKVRSVIISFKTIGRMFGAMALWNFGFELIESAKETYKAKNEIESLLEKNDKVDASGVQVFNKALDDTIERFQKVNKYSLGETASSIGLEFNLNAQEMAKSLPIIAMIQSEYVRAGRTVEEAGLAVKDILQGEFMRLSRETGVGKEELINAGWSGDNKDVISLMEALDKIGKARHWDLFAEKATSLNDILTITKSRFAELGAEIGTTTEPLIVGAFNTILGAIDGLKQGFEGLGSFGKIFTLTFGSAGAIMTASSLYLALAKDMGILDIATIGWGKSLASSVLHLNKTDVALHGFWKTLLGTISGVDSATVSNMGFTKSLVGRVLGLNQTVIAEKGFGQAITEHVIKMREGIDISKEAVHSEKVLASLRREGITLEQSLAKKKGVVVNLDKASVLTMDKTKILTKEVMKAELTRSQRLAMLTNKIDYATAKEMSRGKALLKTATSTKVLKTAFLGLVGISAVAWFAGVATWTDTVRKRMEAYNDVLQNGESKIKNAQRVLDKYKEKLEGLSESDPTYALTKSNADIAEKKLNDIKLAKELADKIKKTDDETTESDDLKIAGGLNKIYEAQGVNIEKQGKNYLRMKYVAYDMQKAEQERYNFEYASLQHINEHVDLMKKAGASEEDRVKYITEYSAKAEEVAENLKKFNEGDLTAGIYYVLGRLQLMWIDLWNDDHFVNFWNSVQDTWTSLKPTVDAIVQAFGDLAHAVLDFLATDQGQVVGWVVGVGAVIGGLAYKIAPTAKKIKDFGKTVKDAFDKLRNFNKEKDKIDSPYQKTTPEGKKNPDYKPKDYGSWGELGKDIKMDFMNEARRFAKLATQIALAMGVIAVAIGSLVAPLLALALVGIVFKGVEQQAKDGIEGIKLVAPIVIAFAVPVLALAKAIDMMGGAVSNNLKSTLGKTAQVIATGMLLVAEAVIMLVAPMLAIAGVGYVKSMLGDSVEKGKEAILLVSDTLTSLYPVIPVFLVAVALGAIGVFSEGIGFLGEVAIIAGGMAMVAVSILTLAEPLGAISGLGSMFPNLDGVKKGSEAIKACAEALVYVESAIGKMVEIQWDMLKSNIAELLGVDIGSALDDLVTEGGFFDDLTKFTDKFNQYEFKPVEPANVEALNTSATALGTVGDALKNAKTAVDNIPTEFKNGGTDSLVTGYDTNGQKIPTDSTSTEGYFDQLKEPLEQLSKFVNWFNTELTIESPQTEKITAINESANMVQQVNTAVENVKSTMGNIGMGNIATNFAQATGGTGGLPMIGGFGAIAGLIGSATGGGQGDYQSSIGSQLYEMELVLKDLNTFNSHVSSMGNGGGAFDGSGDTGGIAEGLTGMVTAVSDAISQLQTTLSQAVPNIKQSANDIGTGIRDGVKNGVGDLTPLIVPPLVQALSSAKAYAGTYGKGIGGQLKSGFQSTAKLKETAEAEVNYTISYLDGKKDDFYNKGAELGDSLARGFKEHGLKQESPGLMARATLQEMYYIMDSLDEGMTLLPEKAIALGNILTSNFNPSLDVGGLSVDDLGQFETGLNVITTTANDTNLQTSTAFNSMGLTVGTTMQGMSTSINNSFANIKQNTTASYAQLTNTTRNSLRNMQNQTTKNITAIRQSWKGMQNALIASAENIRSQTSEKIRSLESNMGSFWQKIQNPANLLAGGTSVGHHTRIRNSSRRVSKPATAKLMAGSPRIAGGSNNYKISQISLGNPAHLAEYLSCLLRDGTCMAGGGWNFDWSKDIQDTFMKWDTHFNKFNLDSYLKVGKFENDDFPVKGIKDLALDYIEDAISQTTYEHYYNEKYGSPLEAWNAGHFNCVDGARVAIALASAFGFGGGSIRYTTWDGEGHGYAYIPELGVIDATAIQGGYGLKAGKVSYASGSRTINSSKGGSAPPKGDITVNITVNIEGDVDDAKEKGREIGDEINKRIMNVLKRSPHTGL